MCRMPFVMRHTSHYRVVIVVDRVDIVDMLKGGGVREGKVSKISG